MLMMGTAESRSVSLRVHLNAGLRVFGGFGRCAPRVDDGHGGEQIGLIARAPRCRV